jgi:hypothetical protein
MMVQVLRVCSHPPNFIGQVFRIFDLSFEI